MASRSTTTGRSKRFAPSPILLVMENQHHGTPSATDGRRATAQTERSHLERAQMEISAPRGGARAGAARGAVVGVLATVPMTLVMRALSTALRLPPERAGRAFARRTGMLWLPRRMRRAAAVATHFAVGGTMGAAYGLTTGRLPLPMLLKGILHGAMVWGFGYELALPALGLLPPARRDRRAAPFAMLSSHLLWGVLVAGYSSR
jgi:hypothetical protein